MLKIIILISIIYYISAVDPETWDKFKLKHNKNYKTSKDESRARTTYDQWDTKIRNHNIRYQAGKETYEMKHNRFSDLTADEFAKLQKLRYPKRGYTTRPATPAFKDKTFRVPDDWKPTSIDIRTKKIPVRDQGDCGSCWAFASVAVIERYLYDNHDMEVDLSEQNLVDCAVDYGGCQGGLQEDGFDFFLKKGIDFESVYEYNETDNACKFIPVFNDTIGVSKIYTPGDYYMIGKNETKWAWATEKRGWLSVSLATGGWQLYSKGVFKAEDCTGSVGHAVVIVGYGTDPTTKMDYWIIRNSWGDDWGEHGHILLERNSKACKIKDAIYLN